MRRHRFLWPLASLLLAMLALVALFSATAASTASVSGVVVTESGPVSGARVRVRATENLVLTDETGHFELAGLVAGEPVQITGWYTGHYIAGVWVTPTVASVTLSLRSHHTTDHSEYDWTSPLPQTGDAACGRCHPSILPQWANNAHGRAVNNARFFSLYEGTNLSSTAVITPGYLLDFPGTAGNCANCHAPGAAVDGYLTTPMTAVRDVVTAGIHCDFCHKVGGAYLNPATGSVYPNAPGVQSLQLLRPPPGDDIFFGPFDDIPDPDAYLPLMAESQYCAACHQFSFWGTPIYESYDEWLASPYAAAGVTCQDCHMPPNGDEYYALPAVGGLPHPPEQIPSHLQSGVDDEQLLRDAVSLTMKAWQEVDQLQVLITLTNSGAGHDIPTDFPGRNLILTLSAAVVGDKLLTLVQGPVVPWWGGEQAGLPGNGFAKILEDIATGEAPVASYWRPTLIRSDSRIPALGSDTSLYRFALPTGANGVVITSQLQFRRHFPTLAQARGWPMSATTIASNTVTLPISVSYHQFLPVAAR